MNSKNESKMKSILSEIVDYYLELDVEVDGRTPSYYVEYSDAEVMDATHIFSHILGNRCNKSEGASIERAGEFAREIHEIVKKYTGVDTQTFYKK